MPCVIAEGQITVGDSPSFTTTLNVHVPVLFDGSVAVHVTSVVPVGNAKPDAGEHSTVALQLSDPVGVT